MSKDALWEFIIGSFIVSIIFMLVRPGAPAAAAITDVTKALSGLIGTSTDYQVSTNGTQAQ
jgi:hypothetical protein